MLLPALSLFRFELRESQFILSCLDLPHPSNRCTLKDVLEGMAGVLKVSIDDLTLETKGDFVGGSAE